MNICSRRKNSAGISFLKRSKITVSESDTSISLRNGILNSNMGGWNGPHLIVTRAVGK